MKEKFKNYSASIPNMKYFLFVFELNKCTVPYIVDITLLNDMIAFEFFVYNKKLHKERFLFTRYIQDTAY